ncbi:unnamed protein product [Cladocopium goreaui]|uniref:peptidylprolyl isomerase n=1 Tax=Cladocopium goreaui TaxID=2562237 RepID=A0A9P1FU71_9DINO|nr:unnamed protein product [Cladocopium goreaui]
MAKDVRNPEFWNKFMQRPEVQAAMRSKLKYESAAEAAQRTKLDKLERKQRRYEIMDELMKCATNIKHLISPMFRYKITQQYLWKVLCEARKEGILFCDKLRQPQVYHRLQAIKAEITAGPYGVAGWQAEEEVEEDLMDKMVVEADCIPGGIDGEAPDRKQVLDRREIQGVLDFGQKIKTEGNEAFLNENWEGALTRYCQGDEMLKNFAAEPHLDKENKELKTMHRQCLNNKANAALQMDQWQTALRAAESALKLKMDDEKALFRKAQALEGLGRTDEALEVLDEVEQIAEDMDEDFREQILDDVKERREEIKAIEHKAAKSFNNMFKAMGDKQVFGSGRFLADGTSPPPALTGAEERQLKRIKEQDEYRAGKLKYELEQRRKEGKPLVDLPQEPEMPTPNKPPLGFRSSERTRTLTKAQAQQLLEELFWNMGLKLQTVQLSAWDAMAPTGVTAFQYGTGEKSCLSQPRGLHLDQDGNLYVADFGNFCVVRFATTEGNDGNGPGGRVVVGQRGKQLLDVDYLKDIGKPLAPADGEGVLLKNPIDVALNADGSLLVLDCPMGRVQCFEQGAKTSLATVMVPPPRSMPAKSLAVPEAIKHPRSMLRLSDGSLVICDTWSHRVLKYNKDAMAPELLAGSPNSCGCSDSQLNFPSCVAFGSDGCLLVADTNNHRIQRFQPGELTGVTVAGSAAGKAGDGPWELCMPTGAERWRW